MASLLQKLLTYQPDSPLAQIALGFVKGAVTLPLCPTIFRLYDDLSLQRDENSLQERAENAGLYAGTIGILVTTFFFIDRPYAWMPITTLVADALFELGLEGHRKTKRYVRTYRFIQSLESPDPGEASQQDTTHI